MKGGLSHADLCCWTLFGFQRVHARDPKNESLLDAFMDLAVYAIIGWLLLIDKWGK